MTDDDILRMAREAGLQWCPFTACFKVSDDNISAVNALQRFAAMVASAEREACAQVVDDFGDKWMRDSHELSKIIRARGKK